MLRHRLRGVLRSGGSAGRRACGGRSLPGLWGVLGARGGLLGRVVGPGRRVLRASRGVSWGGGGGVPGDAGVAGVAGHGGGCGVAGHGGVAAVGRHGGAGVAGHRGDGVSRHGGGGGVSRHGGCGGVSRHGGCGDCGDRGGGGGGGDGAALEDLDGAGPSPAGLGVDEGAVLHDLELADGGGDAADEVVAAVGVEVGDLDHDGEVESPGAHVVEVEGEGAPHGVEVVLDGLRAVDGDPAVVLLAGLLGARLFVVFLGGGDPGLGCIHHEERITLGENIKIRQRMRSKLKLIKRLSISRQS